MYFSCKKLNNLAPPLTVSLCLRVDNIDDVVHQGLDPGHQGDHRVHRHTVHHQLTQVEDWTADVNTSELCHCQHSLT